MCGLRYVIKPRIHLSRGGGEEEGEGGEEEGRERDDLNYNA